MVVDKAHVERFLRAIIILFAHEELFLDELAHLFGSFVEQQRTQRHIKTFGEDAKLEVMNGRYGPYIAYDGKNYRMPKAMHERAAELTYEECMALVNAPKKK